MNDECDRPESWVELCRLEAERWRLVKEISEARRLFIDATPNRGAVIRAALDRGERWTALLTIESLPEPERRQFLPDLVHFASIDIRDLVRARNIILSLDRDWLTKNVEPLIWSELGPSATDEQFRRLAELAAEVDPGLLSRIAQRALASEDLDIHEVGEDFTRGTKSQSS
jgi:hypothetical protein